VGRQIAFALEPGEDAKDAYGMLGRLVREREAEVERLPNLAAAIAIVHKKPLVQQINENKVRAADPVALFDYYAANETKMEFGIKGMPVDLLVYVVDTTSSIAELNWALKNYARNRNVGELFFNIKYDYNAYTMNRPKEVTKQGFTLPNILKYGGVCADQAYFATEVAKAIGVPSAYTQASSAEVAHAWVGFLQSTGKRVRWNFDSGRYDAYRNVRGNLMEPQSREMVPDSYLSLLADAMTTDEAAREKAAGYTDAALLLLENPNSVAVPAELAEASLTARDRTAQGALDLIEMGLKQSAGYAPGWLAVGQLGESGKMTLEQKKKWADLVQKMCGRNYPDFALAIDEPMIQTVEDVGVQSKLWDAVYGGLAGRPDLAARVRIREGEMWEKGGNLMRAGQMYMDVIQKYVNVTPEALPAVRKAEGVLKQMGRESQVLALYKQAATAVMKPNTDMAGEFLKQSNWYKLRVAYAKKLEEAGKESEARAVMPVVEGETGHP
jgi:hypothetical protein